MPPIVLPDVWTSMPVWLPYALGVAGGVRAQEVAGDGVAAGAGDQDGVAEAGDRQPLDGAAAAGEDQAVAAAGAGAVDLDLDDGVVAGCQRVGMRSGLAVAVDDGGVRDGAAAARRAR